MCKLNTERDHLILTNQGSSVLSIPWFGVGFRTCNFNLRALNKQLNLTKRSQEQQDDNCNDFLWSAKCYHCENRKCHEE